MNNFPHVVSKPLPARDLTPVIIERLRGAGIQTVDDWRRLSDFAKRNIFGITTAMVVTIDKAVTV